MRLKNVVEQLKAFKKLYDLAEMIVVVVCKK
jgi:hypothetical protein